MEETYETRVRSLGQEDPPEEGTATHSSILAGESYGQGIQQAAVHRVAQSWAWLKGLSTHTHTLANGNNAAMNMGVRHLFDTRFSFPLDEHSQVEWLDHTVVPILIYFEETP